MAFWSLAAVSSSAAPLLAQGPAFQSPGTPTRSTIGQTTRFSTDFNPAFGFVIDTVSDWNDGPFDDGFDLGFRLLEINAASYVDPNAWAWVAMVSEDLEAPEVEEAAVELIGLGDRTSVRAGRFFIDFGKQMQQHVEELRTLERPLVLRTFLGEELGGTGAQLDSWWPLGDATPVRASVGVFGDLLGEEEEEGDALFETAVPGLKDIDDLSVTARLTGLTELSDWSQLQFGASLRLAPSFNSSFIDNATAAPLEDLSNTVWGLDLTYGWSSETGTNTATVGIEWLFAEGDLAVDADDGGTPGDTSDDVLVALDGSADGFVAFADWRFNPTTSVGVQYSAVDDPASPSSRSHEFDAYATYLFSELRRLRLGATLADGDEMSDTSRVYLQFTAYIGPHSHGINW